MKRLGRQILGRLGLIEIRKVLKEILTYLDKRDKKKLYFLTASSVAISTLDLFAIVGLYAFANLASRSIAGGGNPPVLDILTYQIVISNTLLAVLGISVIGLFFAKSVISAMNIKAIYQFLGAQDLKIFDSVFDATLSTPVTHLNKVGHSRSVGLTVQASDTYSMRILGSLSLLISDFSLLMILLLTSIFVDPITAAISFLVLFGSVFVLDRYLKSRLHVLGSAQSESITNAIAGIDQSLSGIKEFKIRNATDIAVSEVKQIRSEGVKARAELAYLAQLPKYTLELSLIMASTLTALIQYKREGGAAAAAGLLLLVALGFRMLPAIARIQASLSDLRSALPLTLDSLEHISEMKSATEDFELQVRALAFESKPQVVQEKNIYVDQLRVTEVSYSYVDAGRPTLEDVTISIPTMGLTAIVGPSGSGKSTLFDIILGFTLPTKGNITFGESSIYKDLEAWQRDVSFVSQDVYIMQASIYENVAFTQDLNAIDFEKVKQALASAQLIDWVNSLPQEGNTVLQSRGTAISGGQRQRLGIARALYRESRFILLDEATSALDAVTENEISKYLLELKEHVSVVAISHRLSTVRKADQIIYLSEGKIKAVGTFDTLSRDFTDFSRAAELSGLS